MVADQHCPLRPERSRVRTTLRRARNTAAQVDALQPEWEAYTARVAARAQVVQEARLEAERQAEVDDDPSCDPGLRGLSAAETTP